MKKAEFTEVTVHTAENAATIAPMFHGGELLVTVRLLLHAGTPQLESHDTVYQFHAHQFRLNTQGDIVRRAESASVVLKNHTIHVSFVVVTLVASVVAHVDVFVAKASIGEVWSTHVYDIACVPQSPPHDALHTTLFVPDAGFTR